MVTLSLFFLGPPRVDVGGRAVEIPRRRSLALLAYLAITGRAYGRDELTALLHPRDDREHAPANFRTTLSGLRSALGEDFLQITRTWIRLDWESTTVDVRRFREMIERCRCPETDTALPGLLAQAIDLYRGDLLGGFYLKDSPAYDDWQTRETGSLRRLYASALDRLVALHLERREFDEAIESARSVHALDPLDGSAARRLMTLYAEAGRPHESIRFYEQHDALLRRELGVEPDAETQRLRRQIGARPPVTVPSGQKPWRTDTPDDEGGVVLSVYAGDDRAGARPPWDTLLRSIVTASRGSLRAEAQDAASAWFATARDALNAAIGVHAIASRTTLHAASAAGHPTWSVAQALDAVDHVAGDGGMEHLARAAHAGQILLTERAAEQARACLPAVRIRPLGAHRLADLGPPRRVYQLMHSTLKAEFPPIRSLDASPNNLPTQPNALVGREKEIQAVLALLQRETRLLTLTGPGGCGKTRLALHAAARVVRWFEHGVLLVDLSSLRRPAEVLPAVSDALDLRAAQGKRPKAHVVSPGRYLRNRRMLLILDNFEHLLPAAEDVGDLLGLCPGVKVLATSIEPLALRVERLFSVPPLGLVERGGPIGAEAASRSEAVRLFVARANTACGGFRLASDNAALVARVCELLEGLPLAIELAAARLKVMTLEAILAHLDRALDLLSTGPRDLPVRQRGLRNEIAWSQRLLSDAENAVFRRLSVFDGGFTLEAAKEVSGQEQRAVGLVAALAEKSLLRVDFGNAEPRYTMLRAVREYAREKLDECGETEEAERSRAAHFLRLAVRVEPELCGAREREWISRLVPDMQNLLRSIAWCSDRDPEQGLSLAAILGVYWFHTGTNLPEAMRWLEHYLERFRETGPAHELAKIAYYLGFMRAHAQHRHVRCPEVQVCFTEGLRLAELSGDRKLLACFQEMRAFSGADLSPEARAELQRASVRTARESGHAWTIAWCLMMVNVKGSDWGPDRDARTRGMKEALDIAHATGNVNLERLVTNAMGRLYSFDGDLASAVPWMRRALEMPGSSADVDANDLMFRIDLGGVYARLCRADLAEPLLLPCLSESVDGGYEFNVGGLLRSLGLAARSRGDSGRAVRLIAAWAAIDSAGRCAPRAADRKDLDPIEVDRFLDDWNVGQSMTQDEVVAYALSIAPVRRADR